MLAAPLTAALTLALAGPPATVIQKRIERHTKSEKCSVSVLIPQLTGLSDKATEQKLNRYLEKQWLGPVQYALDHAVKDCTTLYQSSTGFKSVVTPKGILSLKRTLTIEREGGLPTLSQQCYLIDVAKGGKYDVAKLLGKEGLAKLSGLVEKSLAGQKGKSPLKRADLHLTDKNFSACTDGKKLEVQLGASLVRDDRTAVEVVVPLDALDGLDALASP